MVFLSPSINAFFHNNPKLNNSSGPSSYRIDANGPYLDIAIENVGNVWLTITNNAQFGTGWIGSITDPVTGQVAPSCMFPANSNINYLYVGGFWIGAVVGRDTLVSIGIDDFYQVIEFWPDPAPRGQISRSSIRTSSPYYSDNAKSELDIHVIYTDTVTKPTLVVSDLTDGRPHIPLNIEVTQRSYAWSYEYAEDFVLFDYSIKNIGQKSLENVYMAVYVDGDVHHESMFGPEGYGEDICGFRRTFPSTGICKYMDTINIAYITDNDGDPNPETHEITSGSANGIAGIRVVRTPSDSLRYSFNWWATDYGSAARDFGPRKKGTDEHPFRDMGGVLGTPYGDRNKYYIMRNDEFDYDQLFTAKDHTSDGWLQRPQNAVDIADGYDARYLLSFGPFSLHAGEILPVSFAWVCGENLHVRGRDFEEYYDYNSPEGYYSKFDFSDLAKNSVWASWIYDNPGVDTDGDGYRGKYRTCCSEYDIEVDNSVTPPETTIICINADTAYYEGDKIPDFKGASPPPAPVVKIYPSVDENNRGSLTIRWNGFESELTRDVFSNQYDFEGYRVYKALEPTNSEYELITSYDKEDYNRWYWDNNKSKWTLPSNPPFTLDSLRKLYGEYFDPLQYGIDNPFFVAGPDGDSSYYFSRQDWNSSDLTDTMFIHKRFPEQPFPTILNLDSAAFYYPEELTDEGEFKYFEYEYVLRNLLPSQLYYVSVTAFDYGSPGHGLGALETKPVANTVSEFPQNSANLVESGNLDVIVYPNPYRADGRYRAHGFEGRGMEFLPDERVRALHFTNLPRKCKIRIFTIDGDLVREIDHDCKPESTGCMHEQWDLITRNTQAAVSGIYYYSIESALGNQIGIFVLIM